MPETPLLSIAVWAFAAGLAWASGLRVFMVLFLLGLAGRFDALSLPPTLEGLQNGWVLTVTGVLLAAELVIDKIPGVDSFWDMACTLLRVPAGAAVAATVVAAEPHTSLGLVLAAGVLGSVLASLAHVTKASLRASVNTSAQGQGLWLSLAGDLGVPAMLWLSWREPALWLGALALIGPLCLGLSWALARQLSNYWSRMLGARVGLAYGAPMEARDSQPSAIATTAARSERVLREAPVSSSLAAARAVIQANRGQNPLPADWAAAVATAAAAGTAAAAAAATATANSDGAPSASMAPARGSVWKPIGAPTASDDIDSRSAADTPGPQAQHLKEHAQ